MIGLMAETESSIYPKGLMTITNAPSKLYYAGSIGIINQHRNIAVIGSRQVSDNGILLAYQTGYALAKSDINVVNGLARGCDTYALDGALAVSGKCVAVLPCGLDQIVPRCNTGLAARILSKGGCLLSEYLPETVVQKYQYIERDRLQSGISEAVIVIESGYDSGTMHTVRYAMKQGRSIACFDSRLVKNASGNRWLEQQYGIEVFRTIEDLEHFLSKIQNQWKYRQMTVEELMRIN